MVKRFECNDVVRQYVATIADGTQVVTRDGECIVIAPIWFPDGEHIEIWIEPTDQDVMHLTDDGQAESYLFINGLKISDRIEESIKEVASAYGISYEQGELFIDTNLTEVGDAIHQLIMGIQGVAHLVHKKSRTTARTFREKVEEYLLEQEQNYEVGRTIQGKTSAHSLAFYLNQGRNWLIEPLSATTVNSARNSFKGSVLFKWIDIKRVTDQYTRITLLDDRKQRATVWQDESLMRMIQEYSDEVIEWSRKERLIRGV